MKSLQEIEKKKFECYEEREKFSLLMKQNIEMAYNEHFQLAAKIHYAVYTEKISMLEWVLKNE